MTFVLHIVNIVFEKSVYRKKYQDSLIHIDYPGMLNKIFY